MFFTDTLMKATVAGARSVGVGGWMGEECESAALERLVRRPCLTSLIAYRQGRLAAIDELRFLTHYRRMEKETTVQLQEEDNPVEDTGFLETLEKIECDDLLHLCSPKVQIVLRLVMCGYTQEAAGKIIGLSPSHTSHLIARDARRLKPVVTYRSEDE